MKTLMLCVALSATILYGQGASHKSSQNEGLWEGYEGEWNHVARQIISLAETIPAEKYSWRPAPQVRSVSEVLVHIAQTNFSMLSVVGVKMPVDMASKDLEKTLTTKAEIVADLKRSFDAVRAARTQLKPQDLERKVSIAGKTVTVDGIYLRIIVHANEHMGQLIAYARMNGIAPAWSVP